MLRKIYIFFPTLYLFIYLFFSQKLVVDHNFILVASFEWKLQDILQEIDWKNYVY